MAATALYELAMVQQEANRPQEAEQSVWESIKLREAAAPNDLANLATGYHLLAELRLRQGRGAEAEPAFKKTIELFGKLGKSDGGEDAVVYVHLGDAQFAA